MPVKKLKTVEDKIADIRSMCQREVFHVTEFPTHNSLWVNGDNHHTLKYHGYELLKFPHFTIAVFQEEFIS